MEQEKIPEEKIINPQKANAEEPIKDPSGGGNELSSTLINLQQSIGNRAVQRLILQRKGGEKNSGAYELDDETASRINRERSGGQPLEADLSKQMGEATGYDFRGVRVHTSQESDALNEELGAKAFTTGQDIFFREGAYEPHSSSGKELISHELTHVVQQNSGVVSGGGRMHVNPPGDSFEHEANLVAKTMATSGKPTSVQLQEDSEETIQKQDEEETVPGEEEEETVQEQELEEEEKEE
jgi:hypothetical protein